jgi:RNA polymerase sigma factor (sigma-70 family)
MKDKERKFESIVDENMSRWRQLCYFYAAEKNLADDLFQEALLNIWRNLDSFRGESKITTWAYRIIVNTALLFNRKLTSRQIKQHEFFHEKVNEQFFQDHQSELTDTLYRMIDELEEKEKIIVTLILEGLSYKEISEITGLTNNYIAVKFNRAKDKLRKILKKK